MSESVGSNAMEELSASDICEVEIEKLVAGGDGLGRYKGIPVFVSRSAPGDLLQVRITQRKPQYVRAEIEKILRPGPERRAPPCCHFEACGGCDLQHLNDRAQVEWKVKAAQEALERLSGIVIDVPERVVSGSAWRYRLRTQLQLDGEPGAARAGYFGSGTHDLVPIRECPVLVEPLETFATGLVKSLTERVPRRLDVAVGDGGELSCGPALPGLPTGSVLRRVGDFTLEFDARTFFQGHVGLLDELVEIVVGSERGESACDLYSGVGLFSLPLARRYERVIAVEGDRIAARYLKKNARAGRLTNIEVANSAVESWISDQIGAFDRLVVDPPRQGLSRHVRGALRRLLPARLTYISCHPAALARDIGALAREFTLESLAYLDLFPQTGHLEVVAQLRRSD